MLISLFAVLLASAPAPQNADVWQPLHFLVGTWRGEAKGEPGSGTAERTCEFVLRGRFLHCRHSGKYSPTKENPKGEHHEDWGLISYDKNRKLFVLRQFHVEGFVNEYVSKGRDGSVITFETEAIENIPAGWRAREQWRILSDDEFVETFSLAPPGKDFAPYSETRFKKK